MFMQMKPSMSSPQIEWEYLFSDFPRFSHQEYILKHD